MGSSGPRYRVLISAACVVQCLTMAAVQDLAAKVTQSSGSTTNEAACQVTQPNGRRVAWATLPPSPYWHGTDHLATQLWQDGTVVFRPGGPGFVLPDGSLRMKFLWFKRAGALSISGRRLDAQSKSLRADIDHAFDSSDFQPSNLIFPTPGCWEVTAQVGKSSLTFVTRVVKIGSGPVARASQTSSQ